MLEKTHLLVGHVLPTVLLRRAQLHGHLITRQLAAVHDAMRVELQHVLVQLAAVRQVLGMGSAWEAGQRWRWQPFATEGLEEIWHARVVHAVCSRTTVGRVGRDVGADACRHALVRLQSVRHWGSETGTTGWQHEAVEETSNCGVRRVREEVLAL